MNKVHAVEKSQVKNVIRVGLHGKWVSNNALNNAIHLKKTEKIMKTNMKPLL